MAISIITIDGESYDVGASAGNVAFNNSGTGISAGTVQGAIEEVKLTPGDNITIEDGVISATGGGGDGGYEPPVGGIPKSDLASDVQTSLGKADSALQSESDPVFAASAAHGITSTDINNWNNKASSAAIPTKTSDLTNDSGFITDEDIEDFVTADAIAEIVTGSADVMVVKTPGYIDIVFAEANITVSEDNLVLTEESPNGTFNVSGSHLKNDITVTAPTGFKVQLAGGTAQKAVTIPHVNGTVESTTVTVNAMPTVVSDVLQGNVELESGTASASVGVYYSQYAGPTILANNTLTIKAAAGQSNTGTLQVTGSQLTAVITASVSGTGFTVSNAENGTYGNQASLPSSGGTLYVKFSPTGSTASTGTLTLASIGATSKTVDLTGAVSTLTVSPQSLTFSTDQGVAVTQSFTIQGTNLTNGVTLAVTGTNASMFTLSKDTLTKAEAEAEAGETITVTYTPSGSGDHSGNIGISWDGAGKTVSLSGSAAAAAALDSNGRFQKGGIYYGAESDGNGGWRDNVKVYNTQYKTTGADTSNEKYSGVLNIPSTVTALKGGVETQFTVIGVAEYAFRGNTAITSITLPNTVTSMASHILLGCTGLTYFNTGNGVTGLPYDFGNGLTALQELVIGDSVVDMKVNGSPFYGCSALRTVTLGSSVQRIGQLLDSIYANGVTTIICRGTSTKPVVNKSGLDATSYKISNAANITVYIPSGTKSGEGGYLTVEDQQSNVISGYSAKTIWKYFDDNGRLIEQ